MNSSKGLYRARVVALMVFKRTTGLPRGLQRHSKRGGGWLG